MAERQPALNDDILIRGWVYARYKRILERIKAHVAEKELDIARLRYEQKILRRLIGKTSPADEKSELTGLIAGLDSALDIAEHELRHLRAQAEHYRALIAEIETDLGDRATEYERTLNRLGIEMSGEYTEYEDEGYFSFFWDDDEFLYAPYPDDVPPPFTEDFPDDTDDFLADMGNIEEYEE